ncbi:MAG TPA: hypothetical protein VHK88_20030 [Aquihabitans sp.]|nr:hypothetical protein [Aquihabitans sp.]
MTCSTCPHPATHRLRSGHLLCDGCATRTTAALDRAHQARLPRPLEVQGHLDLAPGEAA